MDYDIEYFGYGANRNPEMMKAIIGRIPEGYPAKISGFELCIQHWEEMGETVKKQLSGSWSNNFRSYCLRPTKDHSKKVNGVVWKITKSERKLIDNWELTRNWYSVFLLEYKKSNKIIQIEIQAIDDPKIKKIANGLKYITFLNNKNKMLRVATKCRLNS